MPGSSGKRMRACDACHTIKIKCELGSIGGDPPCQRCIRLNKDCTVTPPKRSKERVAELEAQVEALTRQLETQRLQTRNDAVPEPTIYRNNGPETQSNVASSVLKRRRVDDPLELESPACNNEEVRAGLDQIISPELQASLLNKYLSRTVPQFPFSLVSKSSDYNYLRQNHPILLGATNYAAATSQLPVDVHDHLSTFVITAAAEAVNNGQKSVELVQALQIVVLWYRTTRTLLSVSIDQIILMAVKVAETLGLNVSLLSSTTTGTETGTTMAANNINCVDAWRAWSVCYMLSAAISCISRTPGPLSWDARDDSINFMLEYTSNASKGDVKLVQYVRAERLCERIATCMKYYDHNDIRDISCASTRNVIQTCTNAITDWKVQLPSKVRCPGLDMYEHLAILMLHEFVLHTASNKQSFSAPFIAGKLSATDFPSPEVTAEHIASLYALRDASQALLDGFLAMPDETLITLPGIMCASRVAYAQYILSKLHIATTGPGNTFGLFLDPKSLKVRDYFQRLLDLGEHIRSLDSRCGPARILISTSRLDEWLQAYDEMHAIPTSAVLAFEQPLSLQEQREIFRPAPASTSGAGEGVVEAAAVESAYWPQFDFGDQSPDRLDDLFTGVNSVEPLFDFALTGLPHSQQDAVVEPHCYKTSGISDVDFQ